MVRITSRHSYGGTHWSMKWDFREIEQYMEQLQREMPQLVASIVVDLAVKAIQIEKGRLNRMAAMAQPAKFNTDGGRWPEMKSIRDGHNVLANSLKYRYNDYGGEQTVSVFSAPFPTGPTGRRSRGPGDGKLASIHEAGTSEFESGLKNKFKHKGFKALNFISNMRDYVASGFIDAFLKAETAVHPNGPGAPPIRRKG